MKNAAKLIVAYFILFWPIIALILSPESIFKIQLDARFALPSFSHLLGTDFFGRDLFFRLSSGLGFSYLLAISSTLLAFLSSIFLLYIRIELKRPFFQKLIDCTLNYLLVIPTIILASLLNSFFKFTIWSIFLPITLYGFCFLYFSLKPQFLLLKKQPYISFAKQAGFSKWRIIFNHYLKPIKCVLIERLKLVFLSFIAIETGLAFIGISITPTIPSLGKILAQQYQYFYVFPVPLCLAIGFFLINLFMLEKFVQYLLLRESVKNHLFSRAAP